MGKKKLGFKQDTSIFACDTESSTVTGAIWSVQVAPLSTEDDTVFIYDSLDGLFEPFIKNKNHRYSDVVLYFHNLKWDGQHIINWLFKRGFQWTFDPNLMPGEFNTLITDMGVFYTIKIKVGRNIIEIRDSLKLLPFSLKKIGHDFNTKHKKLDMDYSSKQSLADCNEQDLDYLKNDVLVLKEALNIMFNQNMTELTIGSCCMAEYRTLYKKPEEQWCDLLQYKETNTGLDADAYCRLAYRGGFCYVHRTGQFGLGQTYDVNSLYPSMMYSNRRFPIHEPHFWTGSIPSEAYKNERVFFVRLRCYFILKNGHLPMIQFKHVEGFKSNDWIMCNRSSLEPFVLTSVEYELFMNNYDVQNLEILDGCWFETASGFDLFGKYIEHWSKIKQSSTGAVRQIAKLMLNNLYGKLGTSRCANYKVPFMEGGVLRYKLQTNPKNKKLTYVPQACFITAYARQFTILSAEANIERLVYIDTDSIHITGTEPPKNVPVHPTDFSCWKCESTWDFGLFVRQKTYIEHVFSEDYKPCDPYYNVRACGMPERAKRLFLKRCGVDVELDLISEQEQDYIDEGGEITDFNVGLNIPFGKLQPKNTPDGVILVERGFTINNRTRVR